MTSLKRTAEELSNAMMVRARLIDRARNALRGDDLHGAVIDVLNILEHVQDNEQKLFRLHSECYSLIEYCRGVLGKVVEREPMSIVIESAPGDRCGGTRKIRIPATSAASFGRELTCPGCRGCQ